MGVILTERAAEEVKRAIESAKASQNLGDEAVLRVAVVGGGCSGFQYHLGIDNKYDPAKDLVSEQHGVKVVVDKKSELFLDGTTIDYAEQLDRRGFTFNNPNAVRTCGCGSSFSA